MKVARTIFLLFCLTLLSCQQKAQQLTGTWFHLGLTQTENTYYKEFDWNSKKQDFLSLANNPNLFSQNQRTDLYEKLILDEDGTFSTQLFDLRTNEPFDKLLKGQWNVKNTKLVLNVKENTDELYRVYEVDFNSDTNLHLKIVKETLSENREKTMDYDLSVKEKAFKDVIAQIGVDQNDFLSANDEYVDDFWEIQNFGRYQVLSRRLKQDEDISKYSKSIQDVINGYCWNYVPYYDPIFENTSERLVFNTNEEFLIRFKDLASRGVGCGTLSNSDYSAAWKWNKLENTIEMKFDGKEKIPFEVLNLFRSNDLKNEKFKILAKNEKVMIWEKIE